MSEPRNPLWAAYVKAVAGDATAQAIANRIAEHAPPGVSQPTVNRWLNGTHSGELKPGNVAAFATAYGKPVLQAFVAARLLGAEDARIGLGDEEIAFVLGLAGVKVGARRQPATRRSR